MADLTVTQIVIDPGGDAQGIYDDAFDYASLGTVHIRRASFVEPQEGGGWWADLSPVRGPRLGPFDKRAAALEAEVSWLRLHALHEPPSPGRGSDRPAQTGARPIGNARACHFAPRPGSRAVPLLTTRRSFMKETVGVVLFVLILLCCVGSCDRGCALFSAAPAPRAALAKEVRR